ncbi:hypothetical protein LXL04_011392 [Taraxacum kok-saghyz]
MRQGPLACANTTPYTMLTIHAKLPPFSDIDAARCSTFTLSPLPVLSCAADALRYSHLFPVRRRRIVSKLCMTLFNTACYTHENLISVLGFCNEDGEKILLYEYVSHGSVDGHLNYSVGLLRPAYTTTIDWSKWRIFWADERVVPNNHVDSNFKLANDLLLAMLPIIPSCVYTIKDTLHSQEAASQYGNVIRELVRTRVIKASRSNDCQKFDLILLDMGVDGHVASLFPNHRVLEVKREWVTFVVNSPKHPPERITFTLPVINSAANVVVVATVEEKAEAVRMAIDVTTQNLAILKTLKKVYKTSPKWLLHNMFSKQVPSRVLSSS